MNRQTEIVLVSPRLSIPNRCCKDKNQTILGDSLGRQGGRGALRNGYAPISSWGREGLLWLIHLRVLGKGVNQARRLDFKIPAVECESWFPPRNLYTATSG